MIDALDKSRWQPIIMLLAFLFFSSFCCAAQNVKAAAKEERVAQQETITLVKASLAQRRNNVLMVSLMLILLVSLMLYYQFKEKQKLIALTKQMADQKSAVKSLLDSAQEEQLRVAKDIHDNIGPLLSVAKMNLSNLTFGTQNDAVLTGGLNLIDQTVAELRNISQQLIPEGLNFGLFNAIEELCYRINQEGTVKIELQLPDQTSPNQLEKNRSLSIYNLVQAIFTDRIKYAAATEIKLNFYQDQNNFIFEMTDNAIRFDVEKIQGDRKMNWTNIALRIDLLDGKLLASSKKITENKVQITLPKYSSND